MMFKIQKVTMHCNGVEIDFDSNPDTGSSKTIKTLHPIRTLIDSNPIRLWLIPDDGIQYNHPDLKQNYDPHASKDINDGDDDPMPQVDNGDDDDDGDSDDVDDDGDINGGDDDDSSLKLIKIVFLRIAF